VTVDGALARELRDLAVAVAEEAGALLRARLLDARVAIETKSSPTDMVSEVDRESEALVVGRLLLARPEDGVLGEEGADFAGTSGVRWLVDPLDGTTNYLYGYPAFSVSIAAEVAGQIVAGAVHNAAIGETFAAAMGQGASRNGRAIRVTAETDLAKALIGTGFSYDSGWRAKQAAVLQEVLPGIRDIRRSGSAAIDLCSVACGRLDGFYEARLSAWDWGAGVLIAREAGAATGDLLTSPAVVRPVVVAAPGVFEALVERLERAGFPG